MAKRAGLGRGLGALLGETAGEVHSDSPDAGSLLNLSISSVRPNPNQPRRSFDEDELEELADSIRQNGILQPIVVRPVGDSYQIVAGERRYTAAKRVGLATIPAVVKEVSDKEMLQLALIENLQRSDLNPLEAAQGYKVLMEQHGLTQEELGKVLSKSRPAIANALRLLELPSEVQDLLSDGTITAGHARAILSLPDDDSRIALAHRVVREGLSVRQTEMLGSKVFVKNPSQPVAREPKPKSFASAAKTLRESLSTKVTVRTVRGRNKIEIEFGNEAELDELVKKILGA